MKSAIAILLFASVGLGVALIVRHNKAVKVKEDDEVLISTFSNKLEETTVKLEDKERLTIYLQTNLTLKTEELGVASNNLTKINAELARTQREMQAAAEAARAELEKKDAEIARLTTETNQLTLKMDDLTGAIDKLAKQITDTEKKLAASEGDREFLLKELKRLQVEKADLERQFNDLAVLRTQIAKLKEELSVARRLEWLRLGIYGMSDKKGAERLMFSSAGAPTVRSNFSLNVELKQDGGATVVAPATNSAPPAAPK
jgi:chromosome segregation ATPase